MPCYNPAAAEYTRGFPAMTVRQANQSISLETSPHVESVTMAGDL